MLILSYVLQEKKNTLEIIMTYKTGLNICTEAMEHHNSIKVYVISYLLHPSIFKNLL